MFVLSRLLSLLVASVLFALAYASIELKGNNIEDIRVASGQKVLRPGVDFGKLRDILRAQPPLTRPNEKDGHSIPNIPKLPSIPMEMVYCDRDDPCAPDCLHILSCQTKRVSLESFAKLCSVVGCSATKDAPLCPVGKCGGDCLCREEIFAKLHILLINDALAELDDTTEANAGSPKDEL